MLGIPGTSYRDLSAGLVAAYVLPSTGLGSHLPPVLAYYTLACSVVKRSGGPEVPAIWMDIRVHPAVRRRGIGAIVLFDAFGRCVDSASEVAAAGIICIAENLGASKWLLAHSFTNLDEQAPSFPQHHWLPMRAARDTCEDVYGQDP